MECQLCGNNEFIRIYKREFAMCSKCQSLERHRMIYDIFNKELLNTNNVILHIYPRVCWDMVFKKHAYYTVSRHDLTDTIFKDNVFDIVMAVHVMEHIHDDIKALSECYRILKPGGLAILPVPIIGKVIDLDPETPESEICQLTGNKGHLHGYTKQSYTDKMAKVGFNVSVSGTIFYGGKQ